MAFLATIFIKFFFIGYVVQRETECVNHEERQTV